MSMVAKCVTILLPVLLLCACGRNNTATASYPKPPIYADAINVAKTKVGLERITTYTTRSSPDTIQRFYETALIEQGWHFNQSGTDKAGKHYTEYGIITSGPAFTLVIRAEMMENGHTRVELHQILSGPFDWPDES